VHGGPTQTVGWRLAAEIGRWRWYSAEDSWHAERVRLLSRDGASVTLWPTGYQFGRGSAPRGDWDANWLLVRGDVCMASDETWSFHDACLTTWEAASLWSWLRAACSGNVAPTDAPHEDSESLLAFTEPNLAFSVASMTDEEIVLRVHLALESGPALPKDSEPADLYSYYVPLSMTGGELLAAADEWRGDIEPYPER